MITKWLWLRFYCRLKQDQSDGGDCSSRQNSIACLVRALQCEDWGKSVTAWYVENSSGHTLSNIPTEVPDTIETMEGERCSQNDLGSILHRFRKSRDDLQYMGRIKSSRRGKIGQEVAVHHYKIL